MKGFLRLNDTSHTSYLNRRSPVYIHMCSYSVPLSVNTFSHYLYLKGRSPVCACVGRWSHWLNSFSHTLYLNGRFASVCESMCSRKLLLSLKAFSHSLHLKWSFTNVLGFCIGAESRQRSVPNPANVQCRIQATSGQRVSRLWERWRRKKRTFWI